MSLASFPRPEVKYDVNTASDPAKIVLTFRGPASAPLAHSIDTSVQPKKKKPNVKNAVQRASPNKVDDKTIAKENEILKKQNDRKKCREEFLDKGILKALHGRIEERVQCACMSTDHLLLQRRTRLRELLLAEEVAYTTQYVAMCQQANARREEDLIRQASEMKANAERERKQFADQKLLQQKVMSCDPARPTLTQKQLKELKEDQLWQIKEKYALKEAQREEERMYHDLMMKNIQAMKENEEENAKLLWKKQKEVKEAFLEQMKWKEKKEEAERQLKEFERLKIEEEVRLFKEAEIKEKEKKVLNKEKMKAEFKELFEQEKEKKEKRKREEEEIERTFNELLKLQAETEKEKEEETNNKDRLKREMDAFLKNSRELKRKQEEEEKLFDQMLQELNEKKRKEKDDERRRLKEAREELFHAVLKEREHQIKEKHEHQRKEAEQERAEIELLTLQLEQHNKIREEYERKCAEERREYQNTLLRQIEEAKEAKKKKKEEEEAFLREIKAKEEKEIEEVKAILKALPIFPQDHPMKTFIKENQPKYPCLHPYV